MTTRQLVFSGGVLALIVLTVQNFSASAWHPSLDIQFALLAGGMIGVAWGLAGTAPPEAPAEKDRRMPVLMGGITVLALLLRLWQLETSVHYFVDELNFAEGVSDILQARQTGTNLPLLQPFHWLVTFPRLYPYWQSLGEAIFGSNLTALRIVSVVLGTLTIPAVYFAGKQLFDRQAGLLAALLLVTFPPHMHFSRLGLNNVADPLFGTLALALLARGLQAGRQRDFAYAGVLLGITQYFYEGGRLLYPAVMGLWLLFELRKYRLRCKRGEISPEIVQAFRRHLAVLALAAGLVALPFYLTSLSYNMGIAPRLGVKGLGADYWQLLLFSPVESGRIARHIQHSINAFAIYAFLPDQSFYYGGRVALVLPYLVPALLTGMVYVLRRNGRILLLILLLASLGNSLLRYSAWASGFVLTFPVLCLLTAAGLQLLWRWIQRLSPKAGRRVALACVVCLCAGQIVYYFAFHLDVFNRQLRVRTDSQDAVFRALDFPPNTQVHLVGDIVFYDFDIAHMQLYLGRPDLKTDVVREVGGATQFTQEYVEALSRDVPHAFFFEPGATADLILVRQYFDIDGPMYTPYNVPLNRQLELYFAAQK